ncbi:MAG: hypothetical protein NT136_02460 [Candidatus Moranbacteria bacterium]|nr:hypothetical protein [Candidatus Moranbacteria bacterium]
MADIVEAIEKLNAKKKKEGIVENNNGKGICSGCGKGDDQEHHPNCPCSEDKLIN